MGAGGPGPRLSGFGIRAEIQCRAGHNYTTKLLLIGDTLV